MNIVLCWEPCFADALKTSLSEGNTLREACELNCLPFDLILDWMNPKAEHLHHEDLMRAIAEGQYIGKHKNRNTIEILRGARIDTLYSPVLLPLIKQIVENETLLGRSLNSVAKKLGISRRCLDVWRRDYPEVDEVCEQGETNAVAFLEETANKYMVEAPFGEKLNTPLFKHMAQVLQPSKHSPVARSETLLKGDRNNPLVLEGININIVHVNSEPHKLEKVVQGEIIDVETPEK